MVRLGLKLISPEVLMDLDHKDSMEINGQTGVLFMVNRGEVANGIEMITLHMICFCRVVLNDI